MSRLISVMQYFLSELHVKYYRFQPCAFLKFRKTSEITSAVEILFTEADAHRFALQNTCGKLPRRSASVLKKDSTLAVSKSCWKVTKIQIYSIRFFMLIWRLPNGRSVLLLCWKAVIGKGISKSTAHSPLGPHTFLHKINTSGVKTRPEKIMILIS